MSYRVVSLVVAMALLVAGCGDGGSPAASDGRISVVASTNVWGSVAQAVGGSDVTVRSLIDDPAADPHGYTDKPEDATLLAEAKVVVYNGGGYDDFFPKLVDAAGPDAKRVVAFDVSGYGEGNEHVWYDLPTVKKVANKIAAELGAVSPENMDTFAANATAFGTKLDGLITQAEQIGKDKPGAKVVATEPIAAYLLETAGLTDATPADFSEAIEEESDPPVAALAETTDLITNKQVVALINNEQTETATTNLLVDAAKDAAIPVVAVSETLPEGVSDYVEWMTNEVTALASAVAGT